MVKEPRRSGNFHSSYKWQWDSDDAFKTKDLPNLISQNNPEDIKRLKWHFIFSSSCIICGFVEITNGLHISNYCNRKSNCYYYSRKQKHPRLWQQWNLIIHSDIRDETKTKENHSGHPSHQILPVACISSLPWYTDAYAHKLVFRK